MSLVPSSQRWDLSGRLVDSFRAAAQYYSKLRGTVDDSAIQFIEQVIQNSDDPDRARVQFSTPPGPVMNYRDSKGPESFWVQGMRVLETNVWLWMDRPDLQLGQLVQSLLMRPGKSSFVPIRQKLERGERPTPAEIYLALREGVDREKIEREATKQGQGISPEEKANFLEWRYGFTLKEQEVQEILH